MLKTKGIDYLIDAKESKMKLESFERKVKEEEELNKKRSKLLLSQEAAREHDTNKSIAKARDGIENKYDSIIDGLNKDLAKQQLNRDKKKSTLIEKRIKEYNEDLINESKELEERLNGLSKKYKVSFKSNSKLYYLFLLPKGLNESAVAGGIIFTLTAILLLMIHILTPENIKWLFYVIFAAIYSLIYVFKSTYTVKNLRYLEESRKIYDALEINNNNQNINANKIRRDPDESMYDLSEFDKTISEINNELNNVIMEKTSKLNFFDTEDSKKIAQDVEASYNDKINSIKEEIATNKEKIIKLKQEKDKLNIRILNEFDNILGEDFNNIKEIDTLIGIMKTHNISNVKDAIEKYYRED